ncbi:MAG: Gfo/Idh/MocA family oxidoreductase [Bryobacteraceae bacterium]|jgi:predicted dehydrogenase
MQKLSRRAWVIGAALAPQIAAGQMVRLPKKVRIALIGLEGHISEILDPMDRLPDVELVAIQDPDPKLVAQVAEGKHGARARRYGDWRELLNRETLDMVGVCGTNGERTEIILECAKRKIHIVAEKPLALTVADLDRVRQAVAQSGIHLTMLLSMRFEARYRAMKQIVEAGEIGEVAQIAAQKSYKLGERAEWMRNRSSYGGTIPYIGVHMVDLMRFTSGRELVEAVSFEGRVGHPEMRDLENTTATIFELDNRGTAALHMDYFRPEIAPTWGDDRLRLAGTRGVVEYQAATGVTVITGERAPREIRNLLPDSSLFLDFLESVYHGAPAGLSLRDIYRVNEIVLAARESADHHQIVNLRPV